MQAGEIIIQPSQKPFLGRHFDHIDQLVTGNPQIRMVAQRVEGCGMPGGIAVFGKFNDVFGHLSASAGTIHQINGFIV
jgi:hypothetical protein